MPNTGKTSCVCNLGAEKTTLNAATCTLCPTGKYKSETSDGQCNPCPANSNTVATGATTQDACICTAATGWQRTTGATLACEQVIETLFSHFEVPVAFDVFNDDIFSTRTNFKASIALSYGITVEKVTLKYHAQGNPSVITTSRRRMLQTGPIVAATSAAGTTVLVEANVYKSRQRPAPAVVLANLRNSVNANIVQQTNDHIAQENGSLEKEEWIILIICIVLWLFILCIGVGACLKQRAASSAETLPNAPPLTTEQLFIQTHDGKLVDARYDVTDDYDQFDIPSCEFFPDTRSKWA